MDTFSSLFSTSYDDMDETSSLFAAEDVKLGLWVVLSKKLSELWIR